MAISVPAFVPPPAAADPRRRILVLSLVGLALFLAWQALALRSFIAAETRPPAWDQAVHLDRALDYRQALGRGRWSELPSVPPLYYIALARAYDSPDPAGAALWLNWFYLALLSAALFGLAFHFRPDWSALPCTLLFLCAPGLQELFYSQLVDLSLIALTAAAYWALVRSEEFRSWAWSLGFGVLFAAGMLHHWSFLAYMLPALYVCVKALGSGKSRSQALACLVLASALFCPWYWAHLGAILPRFFQACADFSVFAWRGGAFFRYFLGMAVSLGPPFWLTASIGILIPQFHRAGGRGWLMTAWCVSSYLFWSAMPQRQMRFLMPGLPALAVAGMGAWPVPMIWVLAAFQVLAAANYPQGWLSRLSAPRPFQELAFFVNEPALSEDWRLADILREAQKRHRPLQHPLANVTLAANHPRFNERNLGWTARRLGLEKVSVRGVDSRLCEFSQFVLLKTGKLGSKNLIDEAQGWFPRAYEESARWPLPDGSAAILYQQRSLTAPPVAQQRYDFQYYEIDGFAAADLRLELGPFDRDKGVYRSALLTASKARLLGVELGSIRVEFSELAFVPVMAGGMGVLQDIRFLRLGELKISGMQVPSGSVERFLESRIGGLRLDALKMDETVRMAGRWRGLSVSAEAAVALAPEALTVDVSRARLGPLPAPPSLLKDLRSGLALTPTPQRPFRIRLAGLTIGSGRLSVP